MTGSLFISFRPADRRYVERLHAYLVERGVPAWSDDAEQPAELVDQAVLDRIEHARAVVAVGEAANAAGEQSRSAHEIAYAHRLGKPVHEIAEATVASGWLPGDDFIAAVGGALAAGSMPSGLMYADAADLVLDSVGDRLLAVIRTVRELTAIDLEEARWVVDGGVPTVVLRAVRKHLAEVAAERLALEGATVRVVPAGAAGEAAVGPGTVDADALTAAVGKHYDVVIEDHGPNKLKVVATVRRLTGLGLQETKELVEAAPRVVVSGLPWEKAQQTALELRQVAADITLRVGP